MAPDRTEATAALVASIPGPSTEADRNHRQAKLEIVLAGMPDEQREVMLPRFLQDRSVDEIAHLTGQSPSSVRRMVGRATGRLGGLLAAGGKGPP